MLTTENIRPVWAEINLDYLQHNMREIRRLTMGEAAVTAVIKANGYGHGAIPVAETVLESGADRLAVAVADEGIELRKAGIDAHILILGYTDPARAAELIAYNLEPCVYHYEAAQAFSAEAVRQNKLALLHIKLDSGMGRIGYLPTDESLAEIKKIAILPNIKLEGIFTHFCTADDADKTFTKKQYETFLRFCDALKARGVVCSLRHCANSAAIIDSPEYHCDMVRAGIILYGLSPSEKVKLERIDLKPVMSLKARVTCVKEIAVGDSVSYGRRFIAERPTKIASIPIGYADGYARLLSGKAKALVHGKRVPVVGSICMDQCMLDITGIEGVTVGDEAVLFGQQGDAVLCVDELAKALGTINYEVVCMISRRVPRVYTKGGEVVKIVNYLYE